MNLRIGFTTVLILTKKSFKEVYLKMAEQRVIVVSETAPRLLEFEAPAARKFLKEYMAYEGRLDGLDAQVPMKRCLAPDDLDTLIQCSEDLSGIRVLKTMPTGNAAAARVRVDLASPIRNMVLPEEGGSEIEQSDDEETAVEGQVDVLYLSNAHIELMLIHALGPQDEMESNGILRSIRMAKDPSFSKISTATGYVRDWKDALRWCRVHVPRGKVLVKNFLANVYPRKLATSLENSGVEDIKNVMSMFVNEYRKGVNARKILTGMDVSFAAPDVKHVSFDIPDAKSKQEAAPKENRVVPRARQASATSGSAKPTEKID